MGGREGGEGGGGEGGKPVLLLCQSVKLAIRNLQ